MARSQERRNSEGTPKDQAPQRSVNRRADRRAGVRPTVELVHQLPEDVTHEEARAATFKAFASMTRGGGR